MMSPHAGVAKSTASAVINDKGGKYAVSPDKQDAVLRAIKALEFEVNPHARKLVMGRDLNTIGLFTLDLDAGVGMFTLRHVQYLLVQAGYDVPIYSAGGFDVGNTEARRNLIAMLRLQRPLAIVTASASEELLPELERFQAEGGFLVAYADKMPDFCDRVVFDTAVNTYTATKHLLDLGHRKIGLFIDGSSPVKARPRYAGFERAMAEHNAEIRDDWLVRSGDFLSHTIQEGGGEILAKEFLTWRERPTAMCIVNDNSAAAFISIISKHGIRVPDDLSVVGHDDLAVARIFSPSITTVVHPVEEIATKAGELLLSRIRGEYSGPPRKEVVQGDLIARESSRAL